MFEVVELRPGWWYVISTRYHPKSPLYIAAGPCASRERAEAKIPRVSA